MATTTAATPDSVQLPVKTDLIPNPLWQYASYTYAWSLWWLSPYDISELNKLQDVDKAYAWNPTSQNNTQNTDSSRVSYVIAEDSGLYPNDRVPGYPLNYQVQTVQFDTIFAPSSNYKSSNLISGNFKILEPYGVTFLDSLIAAGYNKSTKTYLPYTRNAYMLQLDFFGYDDAGNLISTSDQLNMRKRFPITLLSSKIEIKKSGAEYDFTFAAWGQQAHDVQYGKTPKQITVVAATVKDFFTDFQKKLNQFYINDQKNTKNSFIADQYDFTTLLDPAWAKSTINYSAEVPLAQSNANSTKLDLTAGNFNIPAGTEILAIIDRVVAQSGFLTDTQLALGTPASAVSDALNQATPVNIIKTQVTTLIQGKQQSQANPPVEYQIDNQRNQYPLTHVYAFHQYTSFKGESQWIGSVPDSTPYTIKQYNYLYTGQNIDILDFTLKFDMAYYNAGLGYTDAIAASQVSKSSPINAPSADIGVSPKIVPSILALGIPGFGVPNPTPAKYWWQVGDQQITSGMNMSSNANGQKGAEVLKSIYSKLTGDMMTAQLTINGDPSLIKQDDWLYIQNPNTASSNYNQVGQVSQSNFYKKYGHVRTDRGDVIVTFNVNTPVDIDTDITNQGLVWPNVGTRPAIFSGQYRILMIKNVFQAGEFKQVLTLVRYINHNLIAGYNNSQNNNANNLTNAGQTQQVIPGPAWTGPKQR